MASLFVRAELKDASRSERGAHTGALVEQQDELTGRGRALLCAACTLPLTSDGERIDIDGAHEHTRINPHGYVFHFGCFRAAPGCATLGIPTTEDTWFRRYAWRFAHCRGCGMHIGWRFDGEGGGFFGLVLDRLIEGELPQ